MKNAIYYQRENIIGGHWKEKRVLPQFHLNRKKNVTSPKSITSNLILLVAVPFNLFTDA